MCIFCFADFVDLEILHNFSDDQGVCVAPVDACVHTCLTQTNELQDLIGADVLLNNHSEPCLQTDIDSCKSGQSSGKISEQYSPTKNGTPLFRCSRKPRRTSSIKSRSLSPAENHSTAQNNAFHSILDQDSSDLLKDSYAHQGARPKLFQPTDKHGHVEQITRDSSMGVLPASSSRTGNSVQHIQSVPPVGQLPKPDPSTVGKVLQQDLQSTSMPRWADRACQGIRFIDDETCEGMDIPVETNTIYDCSNVTLSVNAESQRRLYLAHSEASASQACPPDAPVPATDQGFRLGECPSDSQESSLLEDTHRGLNGDGLGGTVLSKHGSLDTGINVLGLKPELNGLEEVTSTSLPASPIKRSLISKTKKLRHEVLLNKTKLSPLFSRKGRSRHVESSEEELSSLEEIRVGQGYRNLETFQKAQLKQKVSC